MGKVDELRARKAEREAKRAAEVETLEVEALELEEKHATQGMRHGVDFDVVTTLVGNFVVRKPEFLTAKKFNDAENKSVEEVVQFVAPCVLHPDQAVARAVFVEHGGVAYRLALSLLRMYEADIGKKAGK